MKLHYSIAECASIVEANLIGDGAPIVTHVYYDSRKIIHSQSAIFFALEGAARSGSNYLDDAYQQGIRLFVISKNSTVEFKQDASYLLVEKPLEALQKLAKHHRNQFTYPVVAITGSVGKTTFKEWASHCISDRFRVVKSPKSFNSQLGVALSLLEMHEKASIALIEAGISKPGEMAILKEMIQPDFGIFTSFGKAHRENFKNKEQHLLEKWLLFSDCKLAFVPNDFNEIEDRLPGNFQVCKPYIQQKLPQGFNNMLGVLKSFLNYLQYSSENIDSKLFSLPTLALRMEVFDGVNQNTIINDTYNLDQDALNEALIYQKQIAQNKKRIVVIGLATKFKNEQHSIEQIVQSFAPDEIHFIENGKHIPWDRFSNAVVLIKAHRERNFEHEVAKGRLLKHRTFVEINLSAIKHNISLYQALLPKKTHILAMVKAASYGAGAEKIAVELERFGIQNFGVAFTDEGVALREAGIQSSILVMNPDSEYSDLVIDHQLIPAIYSFEQLDAFITTCIHRQVSSYPIHLKFNTGMNRLGFNQSDKEQLLVVLNAQPEVKVSGIFSHLADADNAIDTDYTQKQLFVFQEIIDYFSTNLNHSFCSHILNSEGAVRFPEFSLDMVRLGISMYGYTENIAFKTSLKPSISWYSSITQIQTIKAGEFVGYGCSFQAPIDMQIAVIPVGYADGFRRSLSNGKGSVFIQGKRCLVVGRVCMDMILVDITGINTDVNEEVEIIGPNQSMYEFAKAMETIPYEVMTNMSKRMHRKYINE